MARTCSLQDWERVQFEALPLFCEPLEGLKVPGFAARFEAKRYIAYNIWQIVLPLVVVMTSYLSTIDRDSPVRVVDLSARVAFPMVFLSLLGGFFFG